LANVNEFVQGKRTTELTNTLNKLWAIFTCIFIRIL
jgi:hypothetical protein